MAAPVHPVRTEISDPGALAAQMRTTSGWNAARSKSTPMVARVVFMAAAEQIPREAVVDTDSAQTTPLHRNQTQRMANPERTVVAPEVALAMMVL